MTSDLAQRNQAFACIWLPGQTEPGVAGRIAQDQNR